MHFIEEIETHALPETNLIALTAGYVVLCVWYVAFRCCL